MHCLLLVLDCLFSECQFTVRELFVEAITSLALVWPEIVPESPHCGCQFEGGSEDFHRKGGKITENRTLTDVKRRSFGINGRFSAVNRRQCGRFPVKKGQGIHTQVF